MHQNWDNRNNLFHTKSLQALIKVRRNACALVGGFARRNGLEVVTGPLLDKDSGKGAGEAEPERKKP